MSESLLRVQDLKVHFPVAGDGWLAGRKQLLKAVDGVDFELAAGETLGVVGESGCGKSTLARAILGLTPVTAGRVIWDGEDLTRLSRAQMRVFRKQIQVIFQDPLASLDPRMNIGEIVAEPLRAFYPGIGRAQLRETVHGMLKLVGILPNQVNRYPHEFSGGQCQRIGIARALVLKPRLVVCDEPVSALDVSIQAQIVNLLMDLQGKLKLSLIFIAHDLSVVRHISHRVLVMYLGHVVEIESREALYASPGHPYTRGLIEAVPIPDPDRERAKKVPVMVGDMPSPINPPSGCIFRTRCPLVESRCEQEAPQLRPSSSGGLVACHLRQGDRSP